MQQPQYVQPQPQYYAQSFQGLGVGDGFKFGCGFYLAGLVAMLAFSIVAGLLSLLLSVLGLGVLQGIMSNLSYLGQVLPLL